MSQQYPQRGEWGHKPPSGNSPQPFVQPHVQPQVPDQWQGKPGYGPREWKPPEVGYWTYPANPETEQRAARPGRRRPPYPSHLVQFPAGLLGTGGRRSRGPSFWRVLYLGTHPVALLMSVVLFMLLIEFVIGWVFAVIALWLAWCALVTIGWGCHVAVSAMTGGHRGRL